MINSTTSLDQSTLLKMFEFLSSFSTHWMAYCAAASVSVAVFYAWYYNWFSWWSYKNSIEKAVRDNLLQAGCSIDGTRVVCNKGTLPGLGREFTIYQALDQFVNSIVKMDAIDDHPQQSQQAQQPQQEQHFSQFSPVSVKSAAAAPTTVPSSAQSSGGDFQSMLPFVPIRTRKEGSETTPPPSVSSPSNQTMEYISVS